MPELRRYRGTAERSGGGFIAPGETIGCEPHLEEVSAIDERDTQALVEAVRGTLCDDVPCARCDSLRAALSPFDCAEQQGEVGWPLLDYGPGTMFHEMAPLGDDRMTLCGAELRMADARVRGLFERHQVDPADTGEGE